MKTPTQTRSVYFVLLLMLTLLLTTGFQNSNPSPTNNPPSGHTGPDKPRSDGEGRPALDPQQKISLLVAGVTFLYVAVDAIRTRFAMRRVKAQQEAKLSDLEKKAEIAPEKVKPSWELARFTLENYFERNLAQVRAIYSISIASMVAGFGIIIWGISIGLRNKDQALIGLTALGSGIIVEFISVTFMAIYRSTLSQATEYVAVLERINAVGMAIQILDSITNDSIQFKDQTRFLIINLLLSNRPEIAVKSPTPSTEK